MAKFSHKIEYAGLKLAQAIFAVTGIKAARKMGAMLGGFVYRYIPIRKEVVLKNLKIAFPELSSNELERLGRKCYISAAVIFSEILSIPSLKQDQLIDLVKLPNLETIKKLHAGKKGLILLTGHFGNWEAAFVSVGLQVGFPIVGVTKNQSNDYVTRDLDRMRTKYGNKVVTLGVSIREVYKALREGKIVSMVGDQRGPSDGPRVLLFNRPSAVYTGPAALSLKSGAPLMFGTMMRTQDNRYEFRLEEVSKEGLPEDEQAAIIEFTQRHTTLLEEAIKIQPESWFWMHNRWKY